jgi:hypothetical protein
MRGVARGRKAPRCVGAGTLALCAALLAPPATAVLAVDAGGARVVVVDDRHEVAARVALGAPAVAVASFGPKDPFAFAALRDGRVVRLDLARGAVAADVTAGAQATGLAASSDGRYLAVALERPGALVVLDRELRVVRELPGRDLDGKRASPVTAVRVDARRRSFLAALPGLPELWEVSYDDAAEPIYPGLVHDFRLGEGIAIPGKLNPRRAPLDEPLDDLAADPHGANVVGTARAVARAQVVNLFVRRRIAFVGDAEGVAARDVARWRVDGAPVIALPARDGVRLLDGDGRETARLPLGGSARLVRAHEASPNAWIAVAGPGGDRLVALDRATRRIAGEVLPAGRVVDVAFANDGGHVLVLVDGPAAALLRYDARTLAPAGSVALEAPVVLLAP